MNRFHRSAIVYGCLAILTFFAAACSSDAASADDDAGTKSVVADDAGDQEDVDATDDSDATHDTGLDADDDESTEPDAVDDVDNTGDTGHDSDVDDDTEATDVEPDITDSNDNDVGTTECAVENPATLECGSGHDELDSNGILELVPDGADSVGCQASGDLDSFQALESTTWTIQGCPGEQHRFRLILNHCSGASYPAHLTVEPVDPICDLDEFAGVTFSPTAGDATQLRCDVQERNHYCYTEDFHEEGGGIDWTILTNSESGIVPDWYILMDVELNWDSHFEYQVTAEVPPLED